MIKIGNMLISPDDISSIHQDTTTRIQIIYKNGVVKNFSKDEIGLSYSEFINEFIRISKKRETDKIFRLITALKSTSNG